jgi:hypothetical protein
MGDKLTDAGEILFRQINPKSFQNGEPGSDRFRPSERDENMLSTDRSSLTSAAQAHSLFVSTGKESAAVFGIGVGEFQTESIVCVEDPVTATDELPANLAHALADYSSHTDKVQKVLAKRLKRLAIARGCLFQAP